MDKRLVDLHREFANLLPGSVTGDVVEDYVEVGGFILVCIDDPSTGCEIAVLTDANGAEVGASLQGEESLMVMVKVPAEGFSTYCDRLAGIGDPPRAAERGLAYSFWLRFSDRAADATAARATDSETQLVERIWLREIDGICELARVLMGLTGIQKGG